MLDNKDKILERINKLMKLAKNEGASIGEVENSMAAIKKLMIKYNLDDSDLLSNTENIDFTEISYKLKSGENKNWKWNLLTVIANNNMCKAVGRFTKTVDKNYRVKTDGVLLTLIGNYTNRKMVLDLFNMCVEKFESLSKIRYEEYISENIKRYKPTFPGVKINKTFLNKNKLVSSRNRYINSYYLGCVNGINSKLMNENSTDDLTVDEVGKYTLMVKKNSELIEEKINDMFGNIRTTKSRKTRIDGGAYNTGKGDAKTSNKMLN